MRKATSAAHQTTRRVRRERGQAPTRSHGENASANSIGLQESLRAPAQRQRAFFFFLINVCSEVPGDPRQRVHYHRHAEIAWASYRSSPPPGKLTEADGRDRYSRIHHPRNHRLTVTQPVSGPHRFESPCQRLPPTLAEWAEHPAHRLHNNNPST